MFLEPRGRPAANRAIRWRKGGLSSKKGMHTVCDLFREMWFGESGWPLEGFLIRNSESLSERPNFLLLWRLL